MRRKQLLKLFTLIAAMVAVVVAAPEKPVAAQNPNLLVNGGFEEGFQYQENAPELAVPLGWTLYFIDDATFEGAAGDARRPETVVWNIKDAPPDEQLIFWRDGTYNLKVFKGLEPMYSGLAQNVTLQPGARYRFTVPIFADIVAEYDGGRKVAPYQENSAGIRLGASPVGATWRDANQINYSGWWTPENKPNFHFNMNNYVFDFTATSAQTTVWIELYGTQLIRNNGFFMDGLSLVQIANPVPPTRVWPTHTPTRPWPTRTPTPRIWPTHTPVPTNTPTITPTPTVTPTPTNTPFPTSTPTNTPTPLPTGPWFPNRATATPSGPWFTETPAPAAPTSGGATDGQAVAEVAAPVVAQPVAAQPVVAANNFLPPTSTPDANGEIYSVVGPGDSVWSIAAKAGLTLEQILELNGFPSDQAIFVKLGDRLKVGQVEPAPAVVEEPASEEPASEEPAAEEGAAEAAVEEVAPTEVPPTPLPAPTQPPQALGSEICLKAYEDTNNNAAHDAGEALMANVAFTILQGDAVMTNYISDGQTATHCIENLDPGAYRITRSKLPNEVLTTGGELAISLTDGASVEVSFGSYLSDSAEIQQQTESGDAAVAVADAEATATPVTIDTTEAETTSSPRSTILTAVAIAAVLLLLAIIIIILSRRSA